MKKIIAAMIALAAVSSAAYASPLTTYQKGQTEINVGMWDASAKSNGYKSDGEWNFTGGLTYGINDKWAAQYQYTGLSTDHTGGNMNELNALYSAAGTASICPTSRTAYSALPTVQTT